MDDGDARLGGGDMSRPRGPAHAAVNLVCCLLFATIGYGFLRGLFVAPDAAEATPMTAPDALALAGLAVINFYGAWRCYGRGFGFWALSVGCCVPVAYAACLAEGNAFRVAALCYVAGVLFDARTYYALDVAYRGGARAAGLRSLTVRRKGRAS